MSAISHQAITEVWDRAPRDFQREAIPHLLMMRCNPYQPETMLLVQGTSGGGIGGRSNSWVCRLRRYYDHRGDIGFGCGSKVQSRKARNTYGPVLAYQLDSIKKPHLQQILKNKLNSLQSNSTVTIFIYTSPECLMKEPWKSVVIVLINRRVLKLVCVDEIHLFVMFGLTFRKEFTLLKASFLMHLIDKKSTSNTTNGCYYLKVPLLLMTATFNRKLMSLLELMIGIKILPHKYLWRNLNGMARRNIKINVDFTTQRLRHIKNVLSITLSGNLDKKCIVYTNTASCLEQIQADIESWMDIDDSILGDSHVIHGDQKPEVKFVSVERFTETIANPEELINSNKFYPRILLATAGSIGAGLDSPDFYAIC